MAFIIAPTADYTSFIDLTYAGTIQSNLGREAWEAASTADQQVACMRATAYISYGYTFGTDPVIDGQVNASVKVATAMLAYIALTEDLFAFDTAKEVIEQEDELTGVGKSRTKWRVGRTDRFPQITSILSSIAAPHSSGVVISTQVR